MSNEKNNITLSTKVLIATTIITSLGYFIDMFDMFLFNVLRVSSLTELGLKGAALTEAGLFISNFQMFGFIIGAYLSGVLGDRIGRKTMLFVAITLYSLGSIGCAFVHNVPLYAVMRFIAGLGLAGELGAGITLITEKLAANRRGIGVMVFIVLGFVGVVSAAFAAEYMYWRNAYLLGGGFGILLFFTRLWLQESRMFENISKTKVARGKLSLILKDSKLRRKYLSLIFIMVPSVFIPQIVWTLSPEIGKAMGIVGTIKPNVVLGIGYTCVIIGDLIATSLSELLKSRKKATVIFLILGSLCFLKYIFMPAKTLTEFYVINGLVGITFGIWVVGAAWAAENFSTNIRSTATTTIPNFARAITIPMNFTYGALKSLGSLTAVASIGICIFILAWAGWHGIPETYGKDLEKTNKT
jgi:MFS family permease